MTSQVLNNPSALNEAYPIKGINNDSQGFRDNFSTIKTALTVAKSEITDLHNKTITVSGDMQGTSGSLGGGAGTTNLSLVLATQANVIPGVYDSKTHNLKLTISNKGLVSEVIATPVDVIQYTGVAGTWTPTIDPYVPGNPPAGTGAITLPRYTVNDQGSITSAGWVTLPNFGIRGHQLTKGYLVAGDANNKSDILPIGLDGQILTVDSTAPLGVRWMNGGGGGGGSYTPPTYAGVAGTWQPSISTYPGDGSLTFPTFTLNSNGAVTNVGTTTINNYGLRGHNLLKGYLIVGDTSNKSSTLAVGVDGQFLVVDSTSAGGVKWTTPTSEAPTPGNGIEILGSNSVNLAFQNLSTSTTISNNDLLVYRDQLNATHKAIKVSDFSTQVMNNIKVVKDTAPQLGGDLDVQNYIIKTTHASAAIAINATNLRFNGQRWPSAQGSANTFLVSDGAGNLAWSTFAITAGTGLASTPSTITGSGVLSLNIAGMTDQTNQYLTGDQVAIYRTATNAHYKVTLNDFLINYGTNVIFVDSYRGKVYEANGSLVHPYTTLLDAINAAVDGSSIILMPGTYSTPVTIAKRNIKIAGFGPRGSVKITEPLIISSRQTSTTIEGISFDFSLKSDSSYVTPALTMSGTTDGLLVKNCEFLRGSGAFSLLPIVSLSGIQNDHVWFDSCIFQGKFTNTFTSNNNNVYVNDFSGDIIKNPTFEVNGSSRTFINNGSMVRLIKHLGGYVEVNNVANIIGHPAYADNYVAVESTASGPSDVLVLRNTSVIYSGDVYYIKKTGSCSYGLTNVVADDSSIYSGTRMLGVTDDTLCFTSVYKDYISSPSTYNVNVNKFKTYNLTLQTNATINLVSPINFDETSSYQGSMTITVQIIQDGVGTRTCTFTSTSTILWDQSATQPVAQTGANKTTIYQFTKIGNTGSWFARCIFKQN